MANSDWASEAFGPLHDDIRCDSAGNITPRPTTVERRVTPERRQVTHEDNGHVWGPPAQLLKLVEVAAGLEALNALALRHNRPNLADQIDEYVTTIKQVLGIVVE